MDRTTSAARQSSTLPDFRLAIEDEALDRLSSSAYSALRTLECTYHAGTLTLSGRVGSYYCKQLAQVLLRDLPGVERIDNRVDVRRR